MDIQEAFQGFLSAADIDEPITLTIADVQMQEVGQDKQRKAVMTFTGYSRGLVLNKTNADTIRQALGKETLQWRGHRIRLYVDEVFYGGKRVPAIRVRVEVPDLDPDDFDSPTPARAATATSVQGTPMGANREIMQMHPDSVPQGALLDAPQPPKSAAASPNTYPSI